MDAKPVEVSGRVVRETVNGGSKSEQPGVVLKTDGGQSYLLRRSDGPSFGDHTLSSLVGSSITTSGIAVGNLLIMRDWHEQKHP